MRCPPGPGSPGGAASIPAETGGTEKPCPNDHPEWRPAQVIDGVRIDEALSCEPDNPYDVAAAVKGTNNISMGTLMQTNLAQDALTVSDDLDADGQVLIQSYELTIHVHRASALRRPGAGN